MRSLIQKLGKPRSWWVFVGAVVLGLLLGGPLVALALAGIETAHLAGFWVILVFWFVAAVALATYLVGLLAGRYRNLHGKSWAQLPW